MKQNTIITISRQYGSAGRELSMALAKKLDIHLFDRQIIHIAASQLGIKNMDFNKLKKLEETTPPMSLKFTPFSVFGINSAETLNDRMYETESKIIKQLAYDGSCVILGRCADHVLKGQDNVYSFFICADKDFREKRGKSVYEGKSLYELIEEDGKRGQYYEYYTGQKWGDPANYDVTINMSEISIDLAVEAIINYIELRQKNE